MGGDSGARVGGAGGNGGGAGGSGGGVGGSGSGGMGIVVVNDSAAVEQCYLSVHTHDVTPIVYPTVVACSLLPIFSSFL